MPKPEVSQAWSNVYLGLWIVWMLVATGYGILGTAAQRDHWYYILGSFLVLEAIGAIAYQDKLPMLTQVFGRYIPLEVLFPVLALGSWRLSQWVFDWIVWIGCAWQVAHFLRHYHSYSKFHSMLERRREAHV
jgi:hypothetical protein